MATTEDRLVIRQLEAARDHLLARGDADAVKSLDTIIGRLEEPEPEPEQSHRAPAVSVPATKDLLTAKEAAEILGVRSVSPVWTWVGQGKLKYERADGWIKITRSSVEQFLKDPALQEEHVRAAELAKILAPFDATDEDLAELYDWYPQPEARETSE